MAYDLDLNYILTKPVHSTCGAIKRTKEGTYTYYQNSCNNELKINDTFANLSFININNDIIWSDLPFLESYCGYANTYGTSGGDNFVKSSNNKILFTKPFSDYIYEVTTKSLVPLYKLKFNYESIENAQGKLNRRELLDTYKEKRIFKSIYNLRYGNEFMYFGLYSDDGAFRCIKIDNNIYYTSVSGVDPLIGLNLSNSVSLRQNGDGIICTSSTVHIKHMCKNKPEIVSEKVKRIDKFVSVEDNPVLLFLQHK